MENKYKGITIEILREIFIDLFYKERQPTLRTKEEVEEIISNPESGYHKILEGYRYSTLSGGAYMGHGGAKLLYKTCLETFPSERTIEGFILVHLDSGTYPLKSLNVKDDETK